MQLTRVVLGILFTFATAIKAAPAGSKMVQTESCAFAPFKLGKTALMAATLAHGSLCANAFNEPEAPKPPIINPVSPRTSTVRPTLVSDANANVPIADMIRSSTFNDAAQAYLMQPPSPVPVATDDMANEDDLDDDVVAERQMEAPLRSPSVFGILVPSSFLGQGRRSQRGKAREKSIVRWTNRGPLGGFGGRRIDPSDTLEDGDESEDDALN